MYVGPRLAVAALALAVVVAVTPGWSVVVAAAGGTLLLGAVAADVALALRASDLQMRREAPGVLTSGTSGAVSLTMHNPGRRAARLELRDASPASLGRRPVHHRAFVGPHDWSTVRGAVSPARRGYAQLGPVTVRTAGPFGLAGRQSTLPIRDRLKVYPALHGRRATELRVGRARSLLAGARPATARGAGTDFDSLREYRPDDELRRINWRATARAGRAIANEYRDERNQQVMLLLDASRMMAATVGDQPRFDHVLDGAMAVAYLAATLGDHVGMVAFDSRVVAMLGPRSGPSQSRRILDALFDVRPSFEAPDYRGAFSSLLARYRRRALLVLLTELTEESAMESLFTALPSLLVRHLVVVGSVSDPMLHTAARAIPRSSEDAYLKAAAVATVTGRDRSAARLRRMGVPVEDRVPEDLAGALADRYLRIKSSGRL